MKKTLFLFLVSQAVWAVTSTPTPSFYSPVSQFSYNPVKANAYFNTIGPGGVTVNIAQEYIRPNLTALQAVTANDGDLGWVTGTGLYSYQATPGAWSFVGSSTPVVGTPTFTPVPQIVVQNYSTNIMQAQNSLNYSRTAYASMNRGLGARSVWLFIGDSTTAGANAPVTGGANGAATLAYPYDLATLLTAHGIPAYNSSRLVDNTYGSTYDPRATWGSGWGTADTPQCLAGNLACNYTTQNTFDFAPGNAVDTFEVVYAQTTSAGTFSLQIDSGTPVTFNGYGATTIASCAVSTTAGTHTLHIKMLTTAMFWSSVLAYNRTTPYIEILNAGAGGYALDNFISNTSPWDSLPNIKFIAPQLTFINLWINDANRGTTPSDYKSKMDTLIQACQISGDVVLLTGNPTNTSAVNAFYASYYAAMVSEASLRNCLLFDTQQSFISWAQSNSNGWMFDTFHPNLKGYYEAYAQSLYYFVTQFFN